MDSKYLTHKVIRNRVISTSETRIRRLVSRTVLYIAVCIVLSIALRTSPYTALSIALSGDTGIRDPGVRGSGGPGSGDPGIRGSGDPADPGIQESGDPGIR